MSSGGHGGRGVDLGERRYREIRLHEAAVAARFMPGGGRLLEVGAGKGYQARYFAELGYEVEAIDVASSPHVAGVVFPVRLYDGKAIPFEARSFDVVFSSCVLEHVAEEDELQREIGRVLKADGVAVHVLPSAPWRLWTNVTHYLWVLTGGRGGWRRPGRAGGSGGTGRRSLGRRLRVAALPVRHGVRGNWLTEAYHFSRLRWKTTLERAGFEVRARVPAGVWYSGHRLGGLAFSLETRRRLARWLGSGSVCYVAAKR